MSSLWVWHSVVVNKSNRPILLQDEHNVYIKDGVGLYQGKSKIKRFQDGRVYLTNKRIIYLDSQRPDKAIAVDLSLVSSAEYVDGFLRSSPKIKAFLRPQDPSKTGDSAPQVPQRSAPETVSWTCVICSYNNSLSVDTDLSTNFPKCGSCGIPPSPEIINAALETASASSAPSSASAPTNSEQCPKCTFINHPSMKYCELCGTPLRRVSTSVMKQISDAERGSSTPNLTESDSNPANTNPLGLELEDKEVYTNDTPYIKFSFRKGGDSQFHQLLNGEIEKHKWAAVVSRGGVNDSATKLAPARETTPVVRSRGIQGLEKIGELQRKQNENILSQSLDDLEQLMHKAHDVLQLAASFGTLVQKRHHQKAPISPLTISKTSSIYHQELARHLCEYLLNAELSKSTSMITTHDLFAAYNRFTMVSQGFGAELISAADFEKCFKFFDSLKLPVKLKTYQSGLRVVTQRLGSCGDISPNSSAKDIHQVIFEYLLQEEAQFLHQKFLTEMLADTDGYIKSKYRNFAGKTVAEVSEHFGWSSSICIEELHQCMDHGLVVFDKHISGTFYYINKFDEKLASRLEDESVIRERAHNEVLSQQKSISSDLKSQHATSHNLLSFDDYGFGLEDVVRQDSPASVTSVSQALDDLKGLTF